MVVALCVVVFVVLLLLVDVVVVVNVGQNQGSNRWDIVVVDVIDIIFLVIVVNQDI